MFFMKENRPNSHARCYSIWILIFIYYFSWPRAGAGSRNFDIPAPTPAKSSGSGSTTLRPWIQNVLLYKMSNLQNVHIYKTSMDTKRPSLTKHPSFLSDIILVANLLVLQKSSTARLQGLCLFSWIFQRVSGNALIVTYYYDACNILLSRL